MRINCTVIAIVSNTCKIKASDGDCMNAGKNASSHTRHISTIV